MPRQPYNPLNMIPSPGAIRERLTQTLILAERLRILLDLAERLRSAAACPPDDTLPSSAADRQEVRRG